MKFNEKQIKKENRAERFFSPVFKIGRDIVKVKKRIGLIFVICTIFIVLSGRALASEKRVVKVAFFPMEGYHVIEADGSYGGMDVEYLDAVCEYTNWKIQYIECSSWEDALQKLKDQEVDLVGSAQYSKEREQIFDYADLSSGHTFGVIATNGNGTIAYEDFKAMKDITFGLVKGYVRKQEFLQYLKDNEIKKPTIVEYENTARLHQALIDGEVDAFVHTFTEIKEGQRLIGRFAPKPFYYITYKNNEDVKRELDQAIADLKINQPELETELMNKFYESRLDKKTLLTTEEKQYIEEEKSVVVGYLDEHYPFSYEEDGVFKGLTRNMLESSAQATGLKFVYKKMNSQQHAQEALKNKEIAVFAYCACKNDDSGTKELLMFNEYAEIPMVLVTKKDQKYNEIETLVTTLEFADATEAIDLGRVVQIDRNTQRECLDCVREQKNQAALCDGYLVEHLLSTQMKYNNLEIRNVLNRSYQVHMAVQREENEILAGILEKTCPFITAKMINEYMLKENVYPLITFSNFVKNNSMIIVAIMLGIITVVIFTAVHMIRDSRKIQRLMYKDAIIDIWNLNYLIYWGEKKLLPEKKDSYAIVCLNIIQFRRYNIIYGWNEGERILKSVAELLKQNTDKKKEICARTQADRFIMLLTWDDWEAFLKRLKAIQDIIEKDVFEHTENHMLTQLGVYPVPKENYDLHVAVNYANQALDVIGDGSISEMKIYDASFEEMIKERHEREKLLEAVNPEEDFIAYYQSKVDIRNEKIVGAEALVRFLDPTANGAVRSPAYFVPYYEKTGKIMEIDFFVLKSACRMLRRRLDEGKAVVPISCNFSRMHFTRADFSDRFEAILEEYQISKDLIEVEITETLIMDEVQHQMVEKTLNILHGKGIRLSIDDFGAGYSSLGVFEQIPASVIKLDRSFLLNQRDRGRQVKIMRGIVRLSEDLEAQIVCEGVETKEDIKLMNEIHAYIAQGYYYSKPVPEAEFESKLDIQ